MDVGNIKGTPIKVKYFFLKGGGACKINNAKAPNSLAK